MTEHKSVALCQQLKNAHNTAEALSECLYEEMSNGDLSPAQSMKKAVEYGAMREIRSTLAHLCLRAGLEHD